MNTKPLRVAFQGEPGAFSEAAAVGLLGEAIKRINGGESVSSLFDINGKGSKNQLG